MGRVHILVPLGARQQSDSCNYSCSSWRGYRTNEMNFRVSLTLNDSILAKGQVTCDVRDVAL